MSSGSLIDLDRAAPPERRWPFYVAWAVGAIVLGGVLASHAPVTRHGVESVAVPAAETPARP